MNTRFIRRSVHSLHAYVPGEQPRDPSIIKLNTNENPYPPSPGVVRAAAEFSVESLRRYPDPQCATLRTELARLHAVSERGVFVGNGSDEVLALCVRAFVDLGGSVGYFEPSYSLYPVLADMHEAARCPVALGPDFEWAMSANYRASLFFLTNPNAPTGMVFPPAQIQAFCAAFPGVVVIDEAYVDFADHDAMDLARTMENVIVARTLSKSYSLAGLRLGYAVGPDGLIDALYKLKDSYNVDAFAQALGLAAVRDQAYMHEQVNRIRATRERVRQVLEADGHTVSPSQTNFLWFRPRSRPAKEVFEALHKRGIVIRWFAGARTEAHLRVTISTDAHMVRFLDALRAVIAGGS